MRSEYWKLGAARMSYKGPKHSGRKAHGPPSMSINCEAIKKSSAACAFERRLAATFGGVR